jgi:hypothetical protein
VVSLASLPIDPINTSSTGLYYTYIPGGSWELDAILESQKYRQDSKMSKQNFPGVVAVGNDLNLSPLFNSTGLVGYWNFDERSGTIAYDKSGNNNNGTLVNGPIWAQGKVGGALQFNGANTCVNVGSKPMFDSLINNFSVIFWGYSNVSQTKRLVSKGYLNQWEFEFRSDNCLAMNYFDGVSNRFLANRYCGVPNNQWFFAAFIISEGALKVYYQGILVNTTVLPASLVQTNYGVLVGSYENICPSDGTFNGLIDDVRIYNRALSASEISALYNATK